MLTEETELTEMLTERFFGHPYTWDYTTRCMYLFLDYTSRRCRQEIGVSQKRIIEACGMDLHPKSAGYDVLRSIKVSLTRTFGIVIDAAGNGENRVYWYNDTKIQREVRQFIIQSINASKVNYLRNALDEIPPQLRIKS